MINIKRIILLTIVLTGAVVLMSCARARQFNELRYEEPSLYYLHVPADYDQNIRWPLFVAFHDQRQDSYDCIQSWFEIADENDFFLLCPQLEAEGEGMDLAVNERILADILNRLYQDYTLNNRFFIAGQGEAASFALSYANRYPQAIEGVSAIEASEYPQSIGTVDFPILIIIEQGDQAAIEAASAFQISLSDRETQTRILEIDSLGSSIPYRVQRLIVDLFEQITN
jgi:hypothetical protein